MVRTRKRCTPADLEGQLVCMFTCPGSLNTGIKEECRFDSSGGHMIVYVRHECADLRREIESCGVSLKLAGRPGLEDANCELDEIRPWDETYLLLL